MRSDVKVGLICAFAIVLAVIIYFVAQGNNHNARAANTSVTPAPDTVKFKVTAPDPAPTPSPSVTPSAEPSLTTALTATSTPVATPVVTPVPVTDRLLAAGGPVGGGPIIPPAPAGATPSSTPVTSPTPATPTTPSMTSSTPSSATPSIIRSPGSSSDSLIPSPSPAPSVRPTLEFVGPSTPSLTSSGTSTTYEIQKGDMLGPIAKKYNVTVKAIEAANPGINPNNLKVKNTIKIPAASPVAASTSTHTPAVHTPTTPAASSTATSSTPKPGTTYKVKKGDTLTEIAKVAYGSGSKASIEKIVAANHAITNPNVLALNTELKLP